MSDGKRLESLVAFAERTLLPTGFTVNTNEKILDDEGRQIAEFDIEIRGRIGSTDFAWLIECRDRPSAGPAPGSWIEQLYGRRSRFGFNKVTAVSTTGYASGAIDFAKQVGIELREVASLSPEQFAWLGLRFVHQMERQAILTNAVIHIDESTCEERTIACTTLLRSATPELQFLKSSVSDRSCTIVQAFTDAVGKIDPTEERLKPDLPPVPVHISACYTEQDYFFIETDKGNVRINSIEFDGNVRVVETLVPISESSEYRKIESGNAISQVAVFDLKKINNERLQLELHKISDSNELHVTIRKPS
jgi:hypothetical protein